MEQFKKDLLKMSGGSIVAPIILGIIAAIFVVLGLMQSNTDYVQFDPFDKGYASLDVVYVMGPFAEKTEDSKTIEFYIAEAKDEGWYIIGTDTKSTLPVYGSDVMDDDIASLASTTVKGKSKEIPSELASYLIDYFSGTGADLSMLNYNQYFGDHYLDTTESAWEEGAVFYIIAVICAVILIILVAVNAKKKKDIKKQLCTLEENGQLGAIFQDFSSGQRIFAKKLKLATAGRYVLDFNTPKNGFEVIPLTNVNNVFKCNMIQEQPTTTNYIALETTEGARYLIAPSAKVNSEFETVIAQLKAVAAANVNGGAQW